MKIIGNACNIETNFHEIYACQEYFQPFNLYKNSANNINFMQRCHVSTTNKGYSKIAKQCDQYKEINVLLNYIHKEVKVVSRCHIRTKYMEIINKENSIHAMNGWK